MRHLDIALSDAALQIGVCQPECDAEIARQRALCDDVVLSDGVEHAKRNVRLRATSHPRVSSSHVHATNIARSLLERQDNGLATQRPILSWTIRLLDNSSLTMDQIEFSFPASSE